MRFIYFPVHIVLFLSVSASAQNYSVLLPDTARMKQHIQFLASDSLQGRDFDTPYPGLDYAASYIAEQAQEIGLNPLGEDYFQYFYLGRSKPGGRVHLWDSKQHEPPAEGDAQKFKVKNVAAYIEGSHPELKNECVILMAHYDHLGISQEGAVFNGADDNASGVASILECATAFMAKPPARTVVFLWVTAEETGLFGSEYYAENPLFPIEKTVACINIDMVGRVYEPRDSIWHRSPKTVKGPDGFYLVLNKINLQIENLADSIAGAMQLVPDKSLPGYFLRSSDHFSFHKRGIPIINLSTGYHADYHKPADDESKISYSKLERMTELIYRIAAALASQEFEVQNQKKP